MISEPRIRPLARPISASTPETIFVTKPSAIAGDVSSAAACASRRASSSMSSSSTAFSIAASTEPPISSVCWIDTADGGHRHQGHEGEKAEDDEPGAEGGLEPASFQVPHQRLENHGQNGREEQREQDLAHRPEGGEHDDRRDHDPDEAPGPDAELGGGAHRSAAFWLFLPIQGRRVADPRVPEHHPDRVRFPAVALTRGAVRRARRRSYDQGDAIERSGAYGRSAHATMKGGGRERDRRCRQDRRSSEIERFTEIEEEHDGCNPFAPDRPFRRRRGEGAGADQGLRQRRAEAHDSRDRAQRHRGGARDGSSGCPDPAGVLLRHAGVDALRARRGRPGPPCAEEG